MGRVGVPFVAVNLLEPPAMSNVRQRPPRYRSSSPIISRTRAWRSNEAARLSWIWFLRSTAFADASERSGVFIR